MIRNLRLTPSIGSVALLGIAIVFLFSGAGVAEAAAAHMTRSAAGPLVSGAAPAKGVAGLRPQPMGQATITWDPTSGNTLTVDISATGLSPASSSYHSDPYPATLNTGSCKQPGKVAHDLNAVTADKYGAGSSATAIKGVAGGIPAKGYYIALTAPAAANQQGALLACADIINPTPSTTEKQMVKTWLHGVPHEYGGEAGFGGARLTLDGTTLTVDLFIAGLAPGSKHDAHIHSGSCEKQGPVVHNLETVVADANGRAHVETTIKGVTSIPGDWYINVHNSTDLNTQAGFQPIACGNVFTRS